LKNASCYGLEHIDISVLEEELTIAPKKLKRNKAYKDTIGGLHIVALDGTEYFRSEKINCEECLEYHVSKKEGVVTHYVHRVVLAQKVGTKDFSSCPSSFSSSSNLSAAPIMIQPILAAEKIRKKDTKQEDDQTFGHEGELTAAKRLLGKLCSLYGPRFIDLFTLDSLYINYPFVSLVVKEYNKDIVARVNDERTTLYKEIEAISSIVRPIKGYDKNENLSFEGMFQKYVDNLT